MKVKKISHIAFLVEDPDKAKEEYLKLFGIEFDAKAGSEGHDTVGYLSTAMGIEIVGPRTPDGPVARTIAGRGEGFALVAFEVPDIEEGKKEMEAAGIKKIGEMVHNNRKVATFHPKDFHGVLVELIQPM